MLLGQVTHSGAVSAGGSYQETVTDPLPAVLPGQYFVIVQADSGRAVPDTNRGNNSLASSAAIPVSVPALTLGTPVSGTIASGQDLYFELNPSAGQDVTVVASSAVAGFAAVFEGSGRIPDSTTFDQSASIAGQAAEPLEFFAAQAAPASFWSRDKPRPARAHRSRSPRSPAALSLTGLGATSGSNAGQVTVPLIGTFFQTGLRPISSARINRRTPRSKSWSTSTTQAYATFDLRTLALGTYGVQVSVAGQTATPSVGFFGDRGHGGPIPGAASFPNGTATAQGQSEGVITYSNTGGTDLIAPLLVVDSDGQAVCGWIRPSPTRARSFSSWRPALPARRACCGRANRGRSPFKRSPPPPATMTLNVASFGRDSRQHRRDRLPGTRAGNRAGGTTAMPNSVRCSSSSRMRPARPTAGSSRSWRKPRPKSVCKAPARETAALIQRLTSLPRSFATRPRRQMGQSPANCS